MDFTIISPLSKKTYPVNWIEINTPKGNFVIQPGHAPMIISLSKKRPLTFGLKTGKRESITIQEGIISITRTHATLITNQDL
jgi:F0F1-type ATP synthase epsilon subunit